MAERAPSRRPPALLRALARCALPLPLLALGLAPAAFGQESSGRGSVGDILAASPCAGRGVAPGTTLLYGVLRDAASGVPLPGGTAVLSRTGTAGDPEAAGGGGEGRSHRLEVSSDDRGIFWFCEAPTTDSVTLHASALGASGPRSTLRLTEGRLHRQDLEVRLGGGTGSVSGRLLDAGTGAPVDAAVVGLEGAERGTLTDSRGRFRISEVPAGVRGLAVEHVAYGEQTVTVEIQSQRTARVEVRLSPSPIALEPIAVTLEQRDRWLEDAGFYHRASRGLGQFVTPEEIEERHLRSFHQILENVQGLDVRPVCRGSHCFFYVGSTTGAGCVPTFYVDGRKVWRPRVMDLDAITSAHDVAAVEVYRGISQTPAEFYGMCGSVVIWTKRGGR